MRSSGTVIGSRPSASRCRRTVLTLASFLVALVSLPPVSAHAGDTHVYINGVHITQSYALIPVAIGVVVILASALAPRVFGSRATRTRPIGVLCGLTISVVGAIGLIQLSPVAWYTADPLVPRTIHDPLMLSLGVLIGVASVLLGRSRWPTRPRYAGFGILLGAWVAYPGLIESFGMDSLTHPLGYLIVLSLPVAIAYVLFRDARGVGARLLASPQARWFGLAAGSIATVFFMFSTGMLTIIPDDGTGVSLAESIVVTLPVAKPLVTWPAIEFWYPSIPLGGMFSVGMVLLMAVLGGLVALNAGLVALQWQRGAEAGRSGTSAGIVGMAAPQACCCCGPLLSQVAIVALGPSAAAPLYLLFADPSSSIGSLFLVGSVAILTATLVRAAGTGICRRENSGDDTDEAIDPAVPNPSRP
jgi:hypothetical protein